MTQWTQFSFTRKARRARGKETTRARESQSSKGKGKGKHNEKMTECAGKGKPSQETLRGMVQKLWQDGTQMEQMLGDRRRSRETSELVSVRQRKKVT